MSQDEIDQWTAAIDDEKPTVPGRPTFGAV
jgi:hypothetical protein